MVESGDVRRVRKTGISVEGRNPQNERDGWEFVIFWILDCIGRSLREVDQRQGRIWIGQNFWDDKPKRVAVYLHPSYESHTSFACIICKRWQLDEWSYSITRFFFSVHARTERACARNPNHVTDGPKKVSSPSGQWGQVPGEQTQPRTKSDLYRLSFEASHRDTASPSMTPRRKDRKNRVKSEREWLERILHVRSFFWYNHQYNIHIYLSSRFPALFLSWMFIVRFFLSRLDSMQASTQSI